MPNYEIQMTLGMTSFLTADYATNTWSIIADDDDSAHSSVVSLIAFYNEVATIFPSTVTQAANVYKVYRRADLPPRVPIFESSWSFNTAPTGSPLPSEVALCMSFQGAQQSGIPQARRRGRVYLGPIDGSANGADGRPTPATVTMVTTAGLNLKQASSLALAWTWGVFSPTLNSAVPVDNGWVDNEWDTQRRRGRDATSRSVF